MKTYILFILIFIPIFCQSQNEKEYSYLNEDTFTKSLYDAIANNKVKNIINDNILYYKFNEDNSIPIKKKLFIKKHWKNIVAIYKSTDLVIVRHNEQKSVYMIYNHCYKHKVIIDNKQKICVMYEIDIPSEDVPCFESKRIY